MNELREKIMYLKNVDNLSFRQISDQLNTDRRRLSKVYNGVTNNINNDIKLDKYKHLIDKWYKEYSCKLKAIQVFKWLKERGANVSYSSVTNYTLPYRSKKKNKHYNQLTFTPGEEGQVDWFVYNHPKIGRIYGFVLILSYSRYVYSYLFNRSSFEFFIEGHLKAFKFFNGLPRCLRYDNLKTVVIKRNPEPEYNPRFLEFSRHYAFKLYACNPGAGYEKGRVERIIRTIKETYLNTSIYEVSIKGINTGLHQWCNEKNNTIHRVTGKKPIDLFQEENLMQLPLIQWNNVNIHTPVKSTKTSMMTFDNNSYSVPDYLSAKPLSIYSYTNRIEIYNNKNKKVATHPRSFEKNKIFTNPAHRSFSRISEKAKSERIYYVIKNLEPKFKEFLTLNETVNEDPYATTYEIFKLLKTNSRAMLVSIAVDCIKRKSPRLKTFLSALNISDSDNTTEQVFPQKSGLLNLTYQARSLKEYTND